MVDTGRIPLVIHKLPVILDTGTGSNFLREDRLTSFLKTQVLHVSKKTKIHDANDKPLYITDSVKLYVHVGRMMELVNFVVCELLAVSAVLRGDFCDQIVKCIHPKPLFVELVDASTAPIVRHFVKQQSAVTKNTKIVSFPKREGCFSKVWSTQCVSDISSTKPWLRYRRNKKAKYLFIPKTSTENARNVALLAKFQKSNTTSPSASF